MGKMDSSKGIPLSTGDKLPKGADSSDATGERKLALRGGVAMGKMDGLGSRPLSHAGNFEGRIGELNDGNMGERECYSHVRTAHVQDEK